MRGASTTHNRAPTIAARNAAVALARRFPRPRRSERDADDTPVLSIETALRNASSDRPADRQSLTSPPPTPRRTPADRRSRRADRRRTDGRGPDRADRDPRYADPAADGPCST